MALGISIVLGANTVNFNNNIRRATRQAQNDLRGLERFAQRAFDKIGAINFISGALSVQNLAQTADAMQSLASKVKITTASAQEYADTLARLRQISNDNQADIQTTAGLYTSSKRALDALGKSQADVLLFTENLTKAMAVGGGSAVEQANALTQLGQALNMGILKGQEFNSVSAQAPIILDLLVEKLGVTRAELKKMGSENKLTAELIFNALVTSGKKLDDFIAQMPITIGGAITVIKNEYSNLVHDVMNGQNSISSMVVNSLLWVGEHFRTLVGMGVMVAGVMGVQMAHSFLLAKAGATSLTAHLIANTQALISQTKATLADAFSVQKQAQTYNYLSTRLMLARMAKRAYLEALRSAIIATATYQPSIGALGSRLAALSIQFKQTAISAMAAARAIKIKEGLLKTSLATAYLAHRAFGALSARLMAVGSLINRHPLIFLGTIIGTVLVGTNGLKGAMDSLGETMAVIGVLFENFAKGAVEGIRLLWQQAVVFFNSFGKGSQQATATGQGVFGNFFKTTNHGLVGLIELFAKGFDLAGATVVTFCQTAYRNLKNLGVLIANVFKAIANGIIASFEFVINQIIIGQINALGKLINQASTFLGLGEAIPTLPKVNLSRWQYGKFDAAPEGGFFNQIQANNPHALQNALNHAAAQAKQISTANHLATGSYGQLGEQATKAGKKMANAGKAGKKAASDIESAAEKAQKAWQDLTQSVNTQLSEYAKQSYDLLLPLKTQFAEMIYQTEHITGKFIGATDHMKAQLQSVAKQIDEWQAISTLQDKLIDLDKQTALIGKDNPLEEFIYDLNNSHHLLSLLSDDVKFHLYDEETDQLIEILDAKTYTLQKLAEYEQQKAKQDLSIQSLEIQDQLAQLTTQTALKKQLLAIDQEAVNYLAKYTGLLNHGQEHIYEQIEAEYDRYHALKKQLTVQNAYHALIDELKNDDENRLDTLTNQLDVLKAHAQITGAMLDMERAKQLISQSVGLTIPTDPYKELNDKTASQYTHLDAGLQSLLDNERLTEEERIKIKEWGAEERLKIEKAHTQAINSLVLSDSTDMFANLTNITKNGLGEQSKTYRIMFAMQQGFAIAQAGIAIQQAISQGLAKGFPAGLADMALAVSHGAKIVSAIKSVVMPIGQAHDGIMSVPKSGTWNLEKGERVLPRHTAKALDETLSRLQGGGQVVNVNVTVNADGGDVQSSHEMGKNLGNAIKLAIQAELRKERRQGGLLYGTM